MASYYGGGEREGVEFVGRGGEEQIQRCLLIPWPHNGGVVLLKLHGEENLEEECRLEIDFFRGQEEREEAFPLVNAVIEDGQSFPYEQPYNDYPSFSKAFFAHSTFVVRVSSLQSQSNKFKAILPSGVAGFFYVKPKLPGRCSHFCTGGFIVRKEVRSNGLGKWMGKSFLHLARDLGYRASFFSLVFQTNVASNKLWSGLGFTELATIPGVARLKGIDGYVDSKQWYYDLTDLKIPGSWHALGEIHTEDKRESNENM